MTRRQRLFRPAESLIAFTGAIRKAADELKSRDQTMASPQQLLGQAARGLESAAQSFSSASPGDLLDQVRTFARNNPTMFIAGSVLAGLALGRFLRSSAERAPENHDGYGDIDHRSGAVSRSGESSAWSASTPQTDKTKWEMPR